MFRYARFFRFFASYLITTILSSLAKFDVKCLNKPYKLQYENIHKLNEKNILSFAFYEDCYAWLENCFKELVLHFLLIILTLLSVSDSNQSMVSDMTDR